MRFHSDGTSNGTSNVASKVLLACLSVMAGLIVQSSAIAQEVRDNELILRVDSRQFTTLLRRSGWGGGRVTKAVKRKVAKELGGRDFDFVTSASIVLQGNRGKFNLKKLHTNSKQTGLIRRLSANYVMRSLYVPNDFWWFFQWGLDNQGGILATPNVDIDAPEAWDVTFGDPSLVVAVIDSGVDYTHPDLADAIWVNKGEIPDNGKDDDGNGFIDDVHGYDFASKDSDPKDDNIHGTHVAGIIAATKDNARGISGVAPGVKIMAVKMLNEKGEGDTADFLRALDYVKKMRQRGVNVRVINASLGGGDYVGETVDVLKALGRLGVVFVAAAGNDGTNNDETPMYPANYRLDNTLSVASVFSDGRMSSFSNYGPTTVDVAAPGSVIFSSIPGGLYFPLDGTSMSSPHVAGVAALVFSLHPDISASRVRDAIIKGAKPLESLQGKVVSGGMVSALGALQNS